MTTEERRSKALSLMLEALRLIAHDTLMQDAAEIARNSIREVEAVMMMRRPSQDFQPRRIDPNAFNGA